MVSSMFSISRRKLTEDGDVMPIGRELFLPVGIVLHDNPLGILRKRYGGSVETYSMPIAKVSTWTDRAV